MRIKVQAIVLDAQKFLKDVENIDMPQAKASAFNRAGKTGITAARSMVAKAEKVPQKLIKSRFTMARARPSRPNIAIYFRHKSISPMDLGARQTKTGVKARGGHNFPGAFIAEDMCRVFKRRGAARLPIDAPRVSLKEYQAGVRNTIDRVVPPAFAKRFDYELNRRIKKRAAR